MDLVGKIVQLTEQRDEARKLASEWSNDDQIEIAFLRSEKARLRAIIEAAPHHHGCSGVNDYTGDADESLCDCWKKDALT